MGGSFLRTGGDTVDNGDFYATKRWKLKRAHILRRDKYLCRESLRYGIHEDADTVHHIYPLDDYPEYALEDWNLISLTGERHNKMHVRQTRQLTELGKQWQRRVSPP